MSGETAAGRPAVTRAAAWLRAGRGGMFLLALLVGAGAGLGAVVFRYLIYFFTWLATGHSQFGQAGYVGSSHLPWLGLGFFVVIPVIGGLLYGPLIYKWAREARGHGVPEVMIAVADNGGRIRWQVSVVKALASALCHRVGRLGGPRGADRADRLGAGLQHRPVGADAGEPAADHGRLRRRGRHLRDLQRPDHRGVLRRGDHLARVRGRRAVHRHAVGDGRRRRRDPVPRRQAVPVRLPGRHRAPAPAQLPARRRARGGRRADGPGVQERAVQGRGPVRRALEGPPGVGQARRPRPRVRPAAARAPADVRRRLPGHVQDHRRRLRALVPGRARLRQDPRDQPVDRDRRLRRHLRPVAVHRRHLRLRLRRHRGSPVRRRGRASRRCTRWSRWGRCSPPPPAPR